MFVSVRERQSICALGLSRRCLVPFTYSLLVFIYIGTQRLRQVVDVDGSDIVTILRSLRLILCSLLRLFFLFILLLLVL